MSEYIYSITFNKIRVLNDLKEEFKRNVKILYIFQNVLVSNIILITNNDTVYCFGSNSNGLLGYGHENMVQELIINEYLSNKGIVEFKSSKFHTIARTFNGKIYCWGSNKFGLLGNGSEDNDWMTHKPEVNINLIHETIVDICCGEKHTLALTSNGVVYAWGCNDSGQIGNKNSKTNILKPFKVNDINGEKVKSIACGLCHSLALTTEGRVYSWGQLGNRYEVKCNSPKLIRFKNKTLINRISCGPFHCLLLSSGRDVYVYGLSELDLSAFPLSEKSLLKLNTNKHEFIEIASHYIDNISIGLTNNGLIYIWGKCGEKINKDPLKTKFRCFDEVFMNYFQTTYNTFDLEKKLGENTGSGRYSEEFVEFKTIASGSYGIVCEARNKLDNEFYAIKKIPFNNKLKKTVTKEVEILKELNYENENKYIVRLESTWIEKNYINFNKTKINNLSSSHPMFDTHNFQLLHIQMELCSKTLKDLIKQLNGELKQKLSQEMTPLGYCISSELFIEILESVNYLHEKNVIHRDLKPTNILITNGIDGRFIKLGDFGLAVIHKFVSQSHTKGVGTRDYMAPEVLKTNKYDTKADIYSLGFIIQELFNIDFNKPIGDKTSLKDKYSNLFDLTERMTSSQKIKRPKCEEILLEKSFWALNLNELVNDYQFESKSLDYSEDAFHQFFMRVKFEKIENKSEH